MKCPFCAEDIQDAAIVCRFCGATRTDGPWRPPSRTGAAAAPKVTGKGVGTLRLAGVFFLLTAAYELYTLQAGVPLAGAVRTGAVASLYHGVFAAVYVAMGLALMVQRPWGFPVFLGGTALYVVDRIALLLDGAALHALATQELSGLEDLLGIGGDLGELGEMGQLVDAQSIVQSTRWATVAVLACWIGFALYVIAKRPLFDRPPSA